MNDLDKLEQLARAATPGPWTDEGLGIYGRQDMRQVKASGRQIARTYRADDDAIAALSGTSGRYEREKVNAAFIAAANPEMVLAMIAALRAACRCYEPDVSPPTDSGSTKRRIPHHCDCPLYTIELPDSAIAPVAYADAVARRNSAKEDAKR